VTSQACGQPQPGGLHSRFAACQRVRRHPENIECRAIVARNIARMLSVTLLAAAAAAAADDDDDVTVQC